MDIDEKVSILYSIRKLDKEEQVPLFDDTIAEIFTAPKPEYAIKLCSVFYDDVYFDEVMYGLIHAVEDLVEGDDYSYLISLGICNMKDGREWSKILLWRKYLSSSAQERSNLCLIIWKNNRSLA